MNSVVTCRDLCHSYGRKEVLKNVDFDVKSGRIFGLLGKNGAGKTTTINVLMGFLQPSSGDCSIFGEPSHDIRPETRKRIGLLHEGHLQYDFMTISQVERFYSGFYDGWKRDVYYSLMDRMDVSRNRKLFRLSCGQRSQVALGLILAQDPDLMILDDYSMGLDAGYRRLFLDYLRDFVQGTGKTVLVTSHIVQDLEKFVDDVIILDRGKVVVQSTLDAFLADLHQYRFTSPGAPGRLARDEVVRNFDIVGERVSIFSFDQLPDLQAHLRKLEIPHQEIVDQPMTLEDAFIGITGKY